MSLPHLLLVLIINMVWGLNFVAIAVAVEHFPPILANCLRFSVVLLLLAPFLKRVEGQMNILLSIAFIMGIVHFGTVFLAMAVAEDMAPIAIAAQTNVPFATLLAVIFLGERIGIWRTMGISLSFVGVVIIGFEPGGFSQIDAIALVLFSALSYAVVAILMRRIRGARPMNVQAFIALAAVPGSILLSAGIETGQLEALTQAPTIAWIAIIYSGIGASIIGHGGMYVLFQRYPVTTVAPFMLLAPVFAVIAAILFLDESLTPYDIIGGTITLLGVLIITLRTRNRQPIIVTEDPLGTKQEDTAS